MSDYFGERQAVAASCPGHSVRPPAVRLGEHHPTPPGLMSLPWKPAPREWKEN